MWAEVFTQHTKSRITPTLHWASQKMQLIHFGCKSLIISKVSSLLHLVIKQSAERRCIRLRKHNHCPCHRADKAAAMSEPPLPMTYLGFLHELVSNGAWAVGFATASSTPRFPARCPCTSQDYEAGQYARIRLALNGQIKLFPAPLSIRLEAFIELATISLHPIGRSALHLVRKQEGCIPN